MSKIFVYGVPTGTGSNIVQDSTVGGDVFAFALAEDGTVLTSHYCSSMGFAKHDIGLTSDLKHEIYKEHYPDGYELEWIEFGDLDGHEGFQAALNLNIENYSKAKSTL
jgi:hypothetical protein